MGVSGTSVCLLPFQLAKPTSCSNLLAVCDATPACDLVAHFRALHAIWHASMRCANHKRCISDRVCGTLLACRACLRHCMRGWLSATCVICMRSCMQSMLTTGLFLANTSSMRVCVKPVIITKPHTAFVKCNSKASTCMQKKTKRRQDLETHRSLRAEGGWPPDLTASCGFMHTFVGSVSVRQSCMKARGAVSHAAMAQLMRCDTTSPQTSAAHSPLPSSSKDSLTVAARDL